MIKEEGFGSLYKDLSNQPRLLQTQLSKIKKRLSCWTNPDMINNVDQLGQMEDSIRESRNQIKTHKYLDENKSLILKIVESQNSGKLSECAELWRS
ncbi:agamous-like MADS-box protein AGL30 [Rosa chinensis]|uniref:agamous-like MADS-box protein AGL30 n=1 Tax=Rosa chinensis TaxID=74649 RepID=UPI001AD8D3CE|nr:agamous-like MADS-box protein AGL30 [Rosa chinensis]